MRARTWIMMVALAMVACESVPSASTEAPPAPASAGTPSPQSAPASAAPAATDRPRFDGRVWHLPPSLRREMRGTTWKPGCPVGLSDLRLLRVNYWGFDGSLRRGPMVVHEDVAGDLLWVFGRLFRARFPVKHIALTKEFVPEEFEPRIASPRSVTASFNCRPVITPLGPGAEFSQHAYGLAVDVNPVQNPFVTADGFVRNRNARRYVDRSRRLKGMIHDGDVVVRSFAAIGWEWGGHWTGGKDYMHFSLLGG